MAKKVLFVATVDSHIELFHLPYLKMFHDKGWEVHVATDTGKKIEYCDKKIKLPIKRSPFKLVSNYKAMRKLREVMKKEGYSIVHCHTPMGGVVARMAGRKLRRQGQWMIYTAHGFHFYKGAPVHYWMMFYPVEWYLAKYTDTLITINNEDYQRARKRFSKRCENIQYVPGVGVDEKKFEKKISAKEKRALRESLRLKDDDKVLACVGRLDNNKNQRFLIRAMKELVGQDNSYQLLLIGPDELNGEYQKLVAKLNMERNVRFLGFREDIAELLQISDVVVSASSREGLGLNLIEALMINTPIIATDNRGHRDIITDSVNGFLVDDMGQFKEQIELLFQEGTKMQNLPRHAEKFGLSRVSQLMNDIYFNNTPIVAPNSKENYPIDFVVLWVDGSDPKWLKKKKQYNAEFDIANAEARYRDWGIFKYWFRAIEEYAPWVNHIYLVTDAQKPGWLKTNHPKLTIVDHKDIIDEKYLPTFNSQAIEMNLHKIPGLSEHFVYFNDDIFLVEKVKKSDFFKNGLPRGIANINAATGMEGDQLYAQTMFNNILLINRHYKKKDVVNKHLLKWINPKYGSFNLRTITQMPYPYFTGYKPFHMPSPLLKSTFNELWEKESEALTLTCSHKFRHRDDLNQDIFTMWQLCKNEFVPKRKSSGKHIQLGGLSEVRIIKRALNNKRIKMLCVNDSVDDDLPNSTVAQMGELLSELFEDKFPERSSYEK